MFVYDKNKDTPLWIRSIKFNISFTFAGIGTLRGLGLVKLKGLGSERNITNNIVKNTVSSFSLKAVNHKTHTSVQKQIHTNTVTKFQTRYKSVTLKSHL